MMNKKPLYNLVLEYVTPSGERKRDFLLKSSMELVDKCILETKRKGIFFVYEENKAKPIKIRRKTEV